MNPQLRDLYGPALESWRRVIDSIPGVSKPLLMEVPDPYPDAARKLMIVGQQTRHWGNDSETVEQLMDFYTAFQLGLGQRRSQFWKAAHDLYRKLNPGGAEGAFLWSNLVKVDENGGRPRHPGLEDAVSALGLLQGEIEITRPDVVVFFTGPSYDYRLASTFPGVEFVPASDNLFQLKHPMLPRHTYRTYHPRYLRRSGRWGVLEKIAEHCRGSA